MGRQTYESDVNYKRAKYLLEEFSSPRYASTRIEYEDNLKLLNIIDYVMNNEKITTKQYKTLLHYCRVYNVKILNSLDFILD